MPITIDRRPGASYRETEFQVASTGAATVVSAQGGIRYNGAAFQMLDAQGQYDPRTAFAAIHNQLYDVAHMLSGNGPALEGAYKTQTFVGGVFLSEEIWWASSAQTIKLSSHSFSYVTNNFVNPSAETWILYSGTAANAVVRKITDSISYVGIVETTRLRTYQ